MRNYVAKNARQFNKASVQIDRKKEMKRRGPDFNDDDLDYSPYIKEDCDASDMDNEE